MAIAVNHQLFTGGWGSPKIDLGGCVLYAPLWRPDQAGSPFNSKPPVPQTLTVTGAVWGYQGRTFAGGDDYISVTDGGALNFTTSAFSAFFWFKVTTVAGQQMLLDRGLASTDGWYFYIGNSAGNANLILATNQASAQQTTFEAAASISANTWYFGGFTRSGAAVKIYRGTVSSGVSDTTSTSGTHVNPKTSSRTPRIGIYDTTLIPFYGTVGEVFVYNRVPTLSEINRIQQSTKWRYS